MAKSWSETRARRRIIWSLLMIVAVSAAVWLFVRNNSELFGGESAPEPPKVAVPVTPPADIPGGPSFSPAEAAPQQRVQKSGAAPEVAPEDERPEMSDEPVSEAAARGLMAVEVGNVNCQLADSDRFSVDVSLRLLFSDQNLRKELLLKREDIKVMTRKVLSTKLLSDIKIDALRSELRTEVDKILENGKLTDIEFLRFNPVI